MDVPRIPPQQPVERQRPHLGGFVVLAAFLWFVASLVLFYLAVEPVFLLFGESPSEAARATSDRYMRVCVIVVAVGPFAIAVLAGVGRLWKTMFVFAFLSLGLALMLGAQDGLRELFIPEQPPEPEGPIHCIERSGGDNDCPGG